MAASDRFGCPSSVLALSVLLRRARRALWIGLLLALAAHLSLTRLRAAGQEQRAAKPLTTQFVKRQPRLTKPLEMKKRPRPKRRPVRREMVAVTAKIRRDESRVQSQASQALGGLARPGVEVARMAILGSTQAEPTSISGAIEGAKEVEQRMDLSLELLDIESLNTGKYHAMVVQDATDKRSLKGFCRLSWLYIPRLHEVTLPATGGTGTAWSEYYIGRCVRNLVDAMNEYTGIDTRVGQRITIDDPEAFRVPWVFHLYFYRAYRLSDGELEMLGSYFVGGGFMFLDSSPHKQLAVASSHIENVRAALETQGVSTDLVILPASHPMYHCYFDFSGPPLAGDMDNHLYPGQCELLDYLEGWEVGSRLVAVLSRKAYYWPWAGGMRDEGTDPTRQFQFGVNTIIFALTQEGSITRRVMDSVE